MGGVRELAEYDWLSVVDVSCCLVLPLNPYDVEHVLDVRLTLRGSG